MTEINLQSPMSAVLENFPGAQRALFRRCHNHQIYLQAARVLLS
jgi:hypothetical protein